MTPRREPSPSARSGDAIDAAPIRCLVPDLPSAEDLLPYLRRIDAQRWYTNFGPLVREFEHALARFLGTADREPHCVTTASGTTALELALHALDLPRGARVLVPAFTFPATAAAVLRAGLTPVLADVDPRSWLLTPELADAHVARHRCAAVIPVAALGTPVDAAAWDAYARASGVTVLVDAAAGLGVQPVAAHLHLAFSLHATKPLGIGEGGIVVTCDEAVAARVRRLSNFGFAAGRATEPATNAKMSEYAAAVGLAQLARWPAVRARRAAVWARYRPALEAIEGVALQRGTDLVPPAVLAVRAPVDGGDGAAAFAADGIESRRWYCPPLHRHPAFAGLERAGELRVAEMLDAQLVGLPFHGFLTPADVDRVAATLRRIVHRRARHAAAGDAIRSDAASG